MKSDMELLQGDFLFTSICLLVKMKASNFSSFEFIV